jgi:hypothetical protein
MAFHVRRTPYYYAMVKDEPGAAYRILSQLAERGINLLAFSAVPIGPSRAQLALVPEDEGSLLKATRDAGLVLDGPHHAFLVQGDDELGALVSVHARLLEAGIDIYASTGVADGRGSYGYMIYVREEQVEDAAKALEV